MKLRSFLAFTLPADVQQALGSMMELMATKVDCFTWAKPERLHCTLKFFGSVEEDLLRGAISQKINEVVITQPSLVLQAIGIGAFPNWRYPRVIWGGLTGDTEAVINLHARFEQAFEPLGVHRDERAFRLHLTLGRLKGRAKGVGELMRFVEKQVGQDFGEVPVDCLTLYSSVLTPQGPIYAPLKDFPLREAPRAGAS